jgi:hypothetical protein
MALMLMAVLAGLMSRCRVCSWPVDHAGDQGRLEMDAAADLHACRAELQCEIAVPSEREPQALAAPVEDLRQLRQGQQWSVLLDEVLRRAVHVPSMRR